MQIYRYMDIGSAKPTIEEQQLAPHHLIDILDPDQPFDAALFSERAHKKIKELHLKGIFPFVLEELSINRHHCKIFRRCTL
jgi:tRNA dimethylallyltransferase